MITNCKARPFPGLGIAIGIFGTYMAVEALEEVL